MEPIRLQKANLIQLPAALAGRIAGQGMTAQAIFLIVRGYTEKMGIAFAPQTCDGPSRSWPTAEAWHLSRFSFHSAHDSILTTEKYLGIRQNLTDAPCDHLGLTID